MDVGVKEEEWKEAQARPSLMLYAVRCVLILWQYIMHEAGPWERRQHQAEETGTLSLAKCFILKSL